MYVQIKQAFEPGWQNSVIKSRCFRSEVPVVPSPAGKAQHSKQSLGMFIEECDRGACQGTDGAVYDLAGQPSRYQEYAHVTSPPHSVWTCVK